MNIDSTGRNDWKWHAVQNRMGEFDGILFFAVRTTGIFCRPSCSSRPAKRENVVFFDAASVAEAAGFRACLRCKPQSTVAPNRSVTLVTNALELMTAEAFQPIDEIARGLGVTSGHLRKTFHSVLGMAPKALSTTMRVESFKNLVKTRDVTTSLYESGFGSSRSLYENASEQLGMTPAVYAKGGEGVKVWFTIADSDFGKLLVAATERGICAVTFGDSADTLNEGLRADFFAAEVVPDDGRLKSWVEVILRGLRGENMIGQLPLDIRATAFQMRVWAELRKIPYGETRSYAQVAAYVGNPKAVRAVARACATNPVAIVNPCHRVIGADGKLSGYRWGIERKARLLAQESQTIQK